MKICVAAVLETEFLREPALAKIMDNRLLRAARELQDFHLIALLGKRSAVDVLKVQLSYNQKYKIRYRIVNNMPMDIELLVGERCGRLGYIPYKHAASEKERALW
jgi:hypothetical protein